MSKRIIYTNDEGGVSVVVPSPEWAGTMEELRDKVVPEANKASAEIVDVSEVPSDRTFRNAWVQE